MSERLRRWAEEVQIPTPPGRSRVAVAQRTQLIRQTLIALADAADDSGVCEWVSEGIAATVGRASLAEPSRTQIADALAYLLEQRLLHRESLGAWKPTRFTLLGIPATTPAEVTHEP
jgi:hypothetical protein